MKILAIDTTHGICSVAIAINGHLACKFDDLESNKQAERLLSITERLLKECNIWYDDLDAIAVNIGPGSFTGVRIGMAAVNGLKLVNKTPLVSVTSLEAVAYPALQNKDVMVALDAKRGQVYCQTFDKDMNPTSKASLIKYDEAKAFEPNDGYILTGNGSSLIKDKLSKNPSIFDENAASEAKNIALIADKKMRDGHFSDIISPLYIRKPDAKKSGKSACSQK